MKGYADYKNYHRTLFVFVFSLFILVCPVKGQESYEDIINKVTQLSFEDPDKAESYFLYLEKNIENLNEIQKERYHLYLAYHLGIRHKSEERLAALDSFDWKSASIDSRAKAFQQYSEVLVVLGRYNDALGYVTKSVDLLSEIGTPLSRSMVLHSVVTTYKHLFMYEESLSFADKMVELGLESSNLRIQCYGMANKLDLYLNTEEYSSFDEVYSDAKSTCINSNDMMVVSLLVAFETRKLAETERYAEAIRVGEEEYKNSDKSKGFEFVSILEKYIGFSYIRLGSPDIAYSYLKKAQETLEIQEYSDHLIDVYEYMSEASIQKGEFQDANAYLLKAVELHKSFEEEILKKSMVFSLASIKASDYVHQLNLAEERNRKLHLENQLAETRFNQIRVLLIWSSLACILLAVVVVFVQKQKAKIKVSLETDALTKVLSRVSLMESCTKAVAEAKRREQPLSLVVFDLDHFKKINDTFGHAVGDWVLKTVSRVVRNSIRDKDILGRLGGEEFVICLPNTDIEQARQLSERCREGLERIIAPVANNKLDISASFGVAKLDEAVDSLDKLLVTADKCLYQAKHLGRNRVATVLDDESTDAYKPSLGLCTLQAEHGQVPLK
ncbi:GGDEF domain-containing protein [Ferrimonas sp. YFM]|uniref:tetratricopeptide repeat-containing diguanylate cyclase n=1 Tax=Ferrimonas sp. YFM TaxID=3028878 RepID=UPI0025739A04|nr:GGDEF domain-containing protein [Ferrimonas sp. YFM]